ncbi:hypothetical protein CYMTET_16945 [Cymbomonas tetramitiformis]|uniref:Chitinase n=1 Tax=Cymbomonas tetramitiformis TaxID=36881 RepID=A0AAE0GBK3_9CHLO|nr:hypothetical protein CYMTET_16945 [Cymbomonas tetramitiformis]|eukprot:gene19819-23704_t
MGRTIFAIAIILVTFRQASSFEVLREPTTAGGKSMLLWAGNPFGFWGGPFNQSKFEHFLNSTMSLRDVVDTVSVPHFFLADPSNATAVKITGGLVPAENAALITRELQKQGFRVEPLIGNFYNTNQIARYRYYWGPGKARFREACVTAVKTLGLDGLNFDFEPNDCSTDPQPCTESDAKAFSQLLSEVQSDLQGLGPHGTNARVSVDTGQSTIAKTPVLKESAAELLITMNTYYGTSDFDIAIRRDIANDGADRFGLGVCPGCHLSSAEDIEHRMGLAAELGVRHIAWWSGADRNEAAHTDLWWDAIRKWKAA